jgi:cation diffusion facilitator CzcD-associated flavoprotein CzcO
MGVAFPLRALRYYLQCMDDLIFVGFRRYPRFAKWFFKRHWLGTVGGEAFGKHFTPRYNPWEQRIPVAIGLKEGLRTKRIVIKTGSIDRFTPSSIVLGDGEEVPCDVCILATGFDLRFVKFEMYVGEERVAVEGIDFYKGMMMGAVPNYFQPVGVWHSAWTQRSETATQLAIKIMEYMRTQGLRTVSVDRRDIQFSPRIMPNYVKRCLSIVPRFYGTYDLPAIDNLLSYRFRPREFQFS